MTRFLQLFSALAGGAMARQIALAEFLGERDWSVDLEAGIATFGGDLTYPIQLLGSESTVNDTWLWAWANPSALPPPLLEAAQQLREYGQQQKLPELTNNTFGLDVADGHRLSMLATGLARKSCYYRGPYENGALFFLVLGLPVEVFAPVTVERACTVINQVISVFEVDHRRMAETFLQEQGFALSTTADVMHAVRDDSGCLDLLFDASDRITEIEATLPGARSGGILPPPLA
jgi:hypothetical protein